MFNATYNKTLVSHWFCSIFGARFFSGVSLGEGIKYSCWTWNVSWCRFCGSKGQGVAGLTHLARHALDVLSRMERHDDASVKYLQRLRCRSYRNSMEFWAGGKGSRNVEYSPIGGYSWLFPLLTNGSIQNKCQVDSFLGAKHPPIPLSRLSSRWWFGWDGRKPTALACDNKHHKKHPLFSRIPLVDGQTFQFIIVYPNFRPGWTKGRSIDSRLSQLITLSPRICRGQLWSQLFMI